MFIYNKMKEYAEVIDNMSRSMIVKDKSTNITYKRANMAFEKMCIRYCKECERKNICWDKEIESTLEAANIFVTKGVDRGKVNITDLPRNFAIRCKYIECAVVDINASFTLEYNNLSWVSRFHDLKNLMSLQLNEIAKAMEDFCSDYDTRIRIEGRKEKNIRKVLKKNGIYVKDMYYYKNRYGIKQMNITLRTLKEKIIKTNIVANVVSDILGENMILGTETRETIKNSMCDITLVQENAYKFTTYFKVMKKEGEILCGDNYAFLEKQCGQSVMILSDGMGTGREAFKESKKVIELLESLITAGFSKEIAIKLMQYSIYLNSFESNMYATVDVCVLDNYTGICEFIKNGAAPSYVKRGKEVYVIESDMLPIGMLDVTSQYECYRTRFQLEDGDVIVMMTDGFEESMVEKYDSNNEIISVLQGINSKNPKVITQELIRNCNIDSSIVDDISILVGVLWKNN